MSDDKMNIESNEIWGNNENDIDPEILKLPRYLFI